jgi:hypothetical protein
VAFVGSLVDTAQGLSGLKPSTATSPALRAEVDSLSQAVDRFDAQSPSQAARSASEELRGVGTRLPTPADENRGRALDVAV